MMKTAIACSLLLLLAAPVEGARLQDQRRKHKSECWQKRPVSKSFLQLNATKPGYGMKEDEIEPFVTVTKDGYFEVACLKDDLMVLGDKHGDGKFEFANQNSRVSIVWYDRIVPKEDRSAMTPQVCFEFCRSVPDSGFFGLSEGRNCYCAPYFKRGAGDSSQCDAVCEGDSSQMCGGMSKQSIYAMHLCADTANDLKSAKEAAEKEMKVCEEAASDYVGELAAKMESVGNEIKDRAGSEGDSITSNYGQMAVVYSGEVERAHEAANGMKDELGMKVKRLGSFDGADFTDAATIADAEDAIADVKKLTEEAEETCGKAAKIAEETRPVRADADNHIDGEGLEHPENPEDVRRQYVPVTYFVEGDEDTEDRKGIHNAVPSTCKGKVIGNPLINQDVTHCAVACDDSTTAGDDKCIGFLHYRSEEGSGMCALLSYVDEISYYTEGLCSEGGAGEGPPEKGMFLQSKKKTTKGVSLLQSGIRPARDGADAGVRCVVKFHDMKGMTHRINSKRAGVDHVNVNVHKRCF